MSTMKIRDVSLFVEVSGQGPPLLLMHGGPGADHWTMQPFRQLSDRTTTVFYDHRCNGRSTGAPVDSMTFENLTADADALREVLGYERWAVLGHSFGGHVALEYALRYSTGCRTWSCSTPAPIAAGPGRTHRSSSLSAATGRRRPSSSGAGSTVSSSPRT